MHLTERHAAAAEGLSPNIFPDTTQASSGLNEVLTKVFKLPAVNKSLSVKSKE
jgi:hypothetical protein